MGLDEKDVYKTRKKNGVKDSADGRALWWNWTLQLRKDAIHGLSQN